MVGADDVARGWGATGAMKRFSVERISLAEANAFVKLHHRHHGPVIGHIFSIAASDSGRICGVAIVGRPVSRLRDNGVTAEVTRLCTDGTKDACSFLYGASARAALALGFKSVGTYILATEPGTSLTAANWRFVYKQPRPCLWATHVRPGLDKSPLQVKLLFEYPATQNDEPLFAKVAAE